MNGILLIDKPQGISSAEVVRRVKGRSRIRVGHLGTLDPLATGVLPLCLGEATKIAQFLSAADKTYTGLIRLGAATDTGDATGVVVRQGNLPLLDADILRSLEAQFVGPYTQVPPMYSALKRDGVPLYELARQGLEVERAPRTVNIASIHLWREAVDAIGFEVSCSKGTYVRVLAEDIGRKVDTEAHILTLRRTRFGCFTIDDAIPMPERAIDRNLPLLSTRAALAALPTVVADAALADHVRHGRKVALTLLATMCTGDTSLVVDSDDAVLAVVQKRDDKWCFARVLAGEAKPGSLYTTTPV